MYKYANNSDREVRRSGTLQNLLESRIDTGVGKSLLEAQKLKKDQKDYDELKKKYMVVLRENTRLKKELAKHRGVPFEQLGQKSKLDEVKIKSSAGLDSNLLTKARDALEDALLLRKTSLDSLAETVVTKLQQYSKVSWNAAKA